VKINNDYVQNEVTGMYINTPLAGTTQPI